MSKRIITRKPTGAELRAQRDQRLSRPYELQEAGRREASFLKNITGAQDDLEWILTNRAWTQLGFERVAEWWDAKVGPVLDGLDLKPSTAMVERVIHAIVADESDLAKVQRRTQREIASIARTNPTKVSRSLHVADETRGDLDGTAADDVSPFQASADGATAHSGIAPAGQAFPAEGLAGKPLNSSGDAHEGEPSPEVQNSPAGRLLPSDTAEGSTGSVATGRLGTPPFTEGQVATPSQEPVLPSAVSGMSTAGGVEDGPASPPHGPSSTDPASDWMATWRVFIDALESLDVDAVRPMLTDAELAQMDADYPYIGKRLTALGVWSTT